MTKEIVCDMRDTAHMALAPAAVPALTNMRDAVSGMGSGEGSLRGIPHVAIPVQWTRRPLVDDLPKSATWEEHMRADIQLMLTCDTVALLDGWAASRGACIEQRLAKELGLRVMPLVILLSQCA